MSMPTEQEGKHEPEMLKRQQVGSPRHVKGLPSSELGADVHTPGCLGSPAAPKNHSPFGAVPLLPRKGIIGRHGRVADHYCLWFSGPGSSRPFPVERTENCAEIEEGSMQTSPWMSMSPSAGELVVPYVISNGHGPE